MLGTSACSALIFTASASAHISVDPNRVVTNQLADVTFSIANAGDPLEVDHVTLGIPTDFDLDDAEAKPGWVQSRTGQAITWSGGRIPKGQYATFSIRGTAPAKAETVLFNVLVGNRTGKTTTYRVPLEVLAHGPRDSGARSLGRAALIVAILAGTVALGALFLGLYLWLRPPPP